MQTYAGSIVTIIALAGLLVSMWAMGKNIKDKNTTGTQVSAALFAATLITFMTAITIAVNYPSLELYCI